MLAAAPADPAQVRDARGVGTSRLTLADTRSYVIGYILEFAAIVGASIGRYFPHNLDAIPGWPGFLWRLWDAKRQT